MNKPADENNNIFNNENVDNLFHIAEKPLYEVKDDIFQTPVSEPKIPAAETIEDEGIIPEPQNDKTYLVPEPITPSSPVHSYDARPDEKSLFALNIVGLGIALFLPFVGIFFSIYTINKAKDEKSSLALPVTSLILSILGTGLGILVIMFGTFI